MLKETMITADGVQFTKKVTYEEQPEVGKKAKRKADTVALKVTVGGIDYDADETSMDRMGRILSVAAWRYAKVTSEGLVPSEAYKSVYEDITIPWKAADNGWVVIPVSTLAEIQEKALLALQEVWQSYN